MPPAGLVADCTVVTVTYNSAAHIAGLLDSLPEAGAGAGTEVLVVDNDSRDATAALVRARTDARLVESGANLGYSGGINRGRRARDHEGPFVVLNPDLRLEPGALTRLGDALQDPAVGIAVPRILDDHGRLFHSLRREPTVRRALGDALLGRHWPRRPAWLSEVVWDDREYATSHPVDWATGAAVLVRAECDRAVGDWDDHRFFLYSEETDYAARARDLGYVVQYVPDAVVVHTGSGSGASPDLAALLAVNRVRYFEKHHGQAHALLFRAVATLHELLRARRPSSRRALRCLLSRRTSASLPGGRA